MLQDGKEENSSGDHNGAASKPVQEEKKVEAPSDAPGRFCTMNLYTGWKVHIMIATHSLLQCWRCKWYTSVCMVTMLLWVRPQNYLDNSLIKLQVF